MTEAETHEMLAHIKDALSDGKKLHTFTEEEEIILKKLIKLHTMLESWGKLGRLLLWILMTTAGAVISWEAIIKRTGE